MNMYTAIVNICKEPEALELGGRPCMKLRLADNTFGKNAETRFFNAIVSGNDADVAKRLRQGDQIVIAGTLTASSYKPKKGKFKGKTVQSDEMPFAKILQVTKSPTFFNQDSASSDSGNDGDEAPDLDDSNLPDDPDATGDDSDNPLADI
jgi:single-stranded DNA-binding protein